MNRLLPLAALASLIALAPLHAAQASDNAKAQPRAAQGKAKAVEKAAAVSPAQLDIAGRVYTGAAECELNQRVSVEPIQGKPGHFKVDYKKQSFVMVPQETTTGAVRLEDRKAGVVWLQIPSKSMLMNQKVGQRMVDACTHAPQRVALAPGS
jgi:hypothetical protein